MHNDHEVKPLDIMLSKTSAYVKSCNGQTKWMYFLISDDDSLEKYNNTIQDKVSADMKKEFDSELLHNINFLKRTIKLHGDEVTGFYYKRFLRWTPIILVQQ